MPGVGCEMDTLQQITTKHQLLLIEDAAQGLMSSYKGKPLGSFGDLACF
ncbi:MAG: DegT/DnrJ/EryC1/StrS family aminotransferase, partial [Sphaerospermopsis kisseleviana]